MEWTRLELSKASVLRKEVDVALRLLARASEASSAPSGEAAGSNSDSQSQNQAALSLSALAESMQARAREIEAFYHQNDHDERSILFEKQRLRLRRALQSLNNGGLGAGSAAGSSASAQPLVIPVSPAAASRPTAARNAPFPAASPSSHQSNRPSAPAARTPANSQTQRTTSKTSADNVASTRRSPAQVNESSWGAWSLEAPSLPAANAPPIRTRITTDMGSFIPSTLPGIYVSDGGSVDSSSASAFPRDGLIDTQIILTPEEFRAYVSRRKTVVSTNAKKRLVDKLCSKSNITSPLSVAASGPYVDPKRIQKELFRPEQPHKWVGGPNGFKPSH